MVVYATFDTKNKDSNDDRQTGLKVLLSSQPYVPPPPPFPFPFSS